MTRRVSPTLALVAAAALCLLVLAGRMSGTPAAAYGCADYPERCATSTPLPTGTPFVQPDCALYPERCVTVTPAPTVVGTPLPRLTATPGTPFVPGPCLTPGRC